MKIGVLALQGDFSRHAAALTRCGAEPVESTTLLKLIHEWGFVPALEAFHQAGKPIFGTCAGLILLARDVENPRQFSLGLIDVGVERNAYGRQRESFEATGTATLNGQDASVQGWRRLPGTAARWSWPARGPCSWRPFIPS